MSEKIKLICSECLTRNYNLSVSRKGRISLNKYCPKCNKHTIHIESK